MEKNIIKDSVHYNMDCYLLENEFLQVKVLKLFGAKIVSLFDKENSHEFLFQVQKKSYDLPEKNAPFENYDTSGIDECFPTIDSSKYVDEDFTLPDHGELWYKKWDYKIENNFLICKTSSDILELDFIRKINLSDRDLKLEYKIKNNSDKDRYYLYAFHPLMYFDDFTKMDFDFEENIVNVKNDDKYDFDYTKLREYEDKKSYKFYFNNEIKNGRYRIIQEDKKTSLEFDYDTKVNKYLGVWVTKGGFKNEYNFAIEPTSGFYDSIEKAYENGKISEIKKNKEIDFYINIKLKHI